MNKERYILVDQNALTAIVNTLRSIDEVKGFDNMDALVGCVAAIEKIISGSPAVKVQPDVEQDPTIQAAAEAAIAEEEAKNK